MRYLADILTFTRFILAIILLCLSFLNGNAEVAFLVFFAGVLTDVFDGTCAKKWPFPKNKTPKYRKYAYAYDMVSDALLAGAQVLFVTLRVNWIIGLIVIFYYVVVCGVVELNVYGKLFGHPDNCTKNSLTKRNFPLAKKILLTRRYGYTLCLGILNAVILFATSWPNWVKYLGFTAGCLTFVFCWFFLRQRRKNISRNAVKLEKELFKKGAKK
ncbi:CDP-alcohol phosphatidyltransferase family protein [Candidatus Saccharibacteria bacterium]|nr:CDP-alcohol phosphatidyltransferase family protein [Candidatus Saccharibacteria bacterium]